MPLQFDKVRTGTLKMEPKELVSDAALKYLHDYEYAAGYDTDGQIMRASSGKQVSWLMMKRIDNPEIKRDNSVPKFYL